MPPKNKFNKNNNSNKQSSQQDIQDPRFKRVHNDPRFLRAKKKDTKVVIDNRFKSMLKSKEFGSGSGPKVDKYGRRIQANNAEKELKRFYHIDEDEDEDEDEEEKTLSDLEREVMEDEGNLEDEISEESDDEDVTIKKPKLKLGQKGYDPMRGKGVIGSSSDEEDTSDEDEEIEDEEESEEEIEVPRIAAGEETRRLALVNMDWDKIKSMDLYQVLNGFKPKTGVIERVSIYPSEFGKQRMEIEEREGPPKDIFKATNGDDGDEKEKEINDEGSDDEEVTEKTIIRDQLEEGGGEDFDQDALRKYQLDRLKYYYAVVECDSPFTAKIICQTCDGNEYESSANFFDIRYIPDDMTFDDDVPRDTCTNVADNYKPVKFSTEALQHTKVKLTWDQDEPERIELTRRDFTEQDLKDLDFEAYLASSSSEDDDDDNDDNDDSLEKIRAKYRKLLQETNENVYDDKDMENGNSDNDDGDMEITFTPGLSELAASKLNHDDDDDDKEDEEEKEETSIEKYMRKQKEKRLAKKERRENKWKEENVSTDTDKNKNNKMNDDMLESDTDEELEQDDYFKEARQEMEQELSLDKKKDENKKDKKKKNKKKKLTKEERLEQKRQKAELELLMDDHQGKGDGFDMKEIMKLEKLEKKKGKKTRREKELLETTTDDFEMNVNDPRFTAVQDSHHFAIDPTNPQFKKTKSMKKLMEARQSKLKQHTDQVDDWKKENNSKAMKNQQNDEKKSKDASLSQLIDSVKRKGALSQPKIGKRQKV